jgi:serine phosphatase RsbU (regulator of sigma subunit)
MASVHTLVRSIASACCGIDQILSQANRILVDTMEGDRFVTLMLGVLTPETRAFVYTSAGHPTGYHLDATGHVKHLLRSTSLPLGIFGDAEFTVSDPVILDPGDLVLILTDGIQEVRSSQGELFGTERVIEAFRENRNRHARGIIEGLYDTVCAFSGGSEPTDDVTAMVIKVPTG